MTLPGKTVYARLRREAAAQADMIMILTPDETQRAIYENDVKPNLKKGKAILFRAWLQHSFQPDLCPPTI